MAYAIVIYQLLPLFYDADIGGKMTTYLQSAETCGKAVKELSVVSEIYCTKLHWNFRHGFVRAATADCRGKLVSVPSVFDNF